MQDSLNDPKRMAGYPWNTKNFAIKNRQDLTQLRAVFEKKLGGLNAIRFGAEDWYAYNPTYYKNQDSLYNIILKNNYTAAFAEADIYLTNNLALKLGGRYEYSTIIKKANVAPRLSAAYKVGKDGQVSIAYGQFYQSPEYQPVGVYQKPGLYKGNALHSKLPAYIKQPYFQG